MGPRHDLAAGSRRPTGSRRHRTAQRRPGEASTTPATEPDPATGAVDAGLVGAARGSGLNLAGALCSQIALFAITALIARLLGRGALGQYALGYAVTSVLGFVVLAGFQSSLTRFVAVHNADRDMARLRGSLRIAFAVTVGLSVLAAVVLIALAGPLSGVFHHALEPINIRLVAVTVPAGAVRDTALAAVQGWRTQRAYALVWLIIEPIARLALTVALISAGLGVTGAFVALAGGSWLAAVLACRFLARRMRGIDHVVPVHDVRTMLWFSSAAWGTALASIGLIWADTLLLGALASSSDVGTYTVATRLVNLAVFVMVPVNAAFAPQFAHLLHRADLSQLRATYAAATVWIARLSLPAFVALVVFPHQLLDLFGSGFSTGAKVTLILAAGQLINALTGPSGALLNMSGRVRLNMIDNIVTLVLNLGLNLWLIPVLGIEGAALAWSASLAVVNIARFVQVHLMIGGYPLDRGTAKAVLAAGCAAVIGVEVHLSIAQAIPQAVAGCAAVGGSYAVLMALFGLGADDKALLAGVVGRRRRTPGSDRGRP